jgi:pimeloyl-ACP methyl ester carboxylesterase
VTSPDHSGPPAWFRNALAHEPEHFAVEVNDCSIHYRAWGDQDRPTLVLVHGGGAHSAWWDHLAPFLAATHRVLAPDLSGHGDSDRRPRYSLGLWAREVLAVSAHASPSARPTIVGHSMGGWVASTAAVIDGDDLDGVVVIDSPLRERAPEAQRLREPRGRPDGYRSRGEIVSRFRAVPHQDSTLQFVAHHIANESVRRRKLRWFWKFDPAVFRSEWVADAAADPEALEEVFETMHSRVSFVRCEHGLVLPDMVDRIREVLQLRGPFIELPEAGHHPMLDQPLALVATLRTLLEMWSIS